MANDLFIRLVMDMRIKQKEYFKTRLQSALIDSKKLEKQVDEAIVAYVVGAEQQELFNRERNK